MQVLVHWIASCSPIGASSFRSSLVFHAITDSSWKRRSDAFIKMHEHSELTAPEKKGIKKISRGLLISWRRIRRTAAGQCDPNDVHLVSRSTRTHTPLSSSPSAGHLPLTSVWVRSCAPFGRGTTGKPRDRENSRGSFNVVRYCTTELTGIASHYCKLLSRGTFM